MKKTERMTVIIGRKSLFIKLVDGIAMKKILKTNAKVAHKK